MRDFLLNEALKRLATEAATRFSTLVASGDQIPFDVAAESGDDSAFYSYVPLTCALRRRARRGAALAAQLRPRPRGRGRGRRRRPLPGGPRRVGPRRPGRARRTDADRSSSPRSGRAATEFSLDRARLDSALSMLDAEARDADDAEVLIVPDRRPADVDRRACSCRTACASSAPTRSRPRSTRCAARAWAAPPGSRSTSPSPSSTTSEGAEAALQPAARADQRDEALQGRRHRPRPLRLRPDRRGLLAADRHRRPRDPPRRLPPQRGRGRASWSSWRARWRPAPTPTAPSPGRSAASRWAASARARSTGSATTFWLCARCSRATARSAPRCRCAPRR